MYLSRYDFAGDPQELHAALTRVKDQIPADELLLNVAVSTESGISLYDACPDRETFVAFSNSEQFKNMLAESGLPTPTITPLGEILSSVANVSAVPA